MVGSAEVAGPAKPMRAIGESRRHRALKNGWLSPMALWLPSSL